MKCPILISNCFPDSRPFMDKFERSQTLPTPQGYQKRNVNPILECIADQINHSESLAMDEEFIGAEILHNILNYLKDGKIEWPSDFALLSKEQWMERICLEHNFYWFHAQSNADMQLYEDLLILLSCKWLKKNIILISFLDGQVKTFKSSDDSYYLMACQCLKSENFFLSIIKSTEIE